VKDPIKQESRCDLIIARTSADAIGLSLRRSEEILRSLRSLRMTTRLVAGRVVPDLSATCGREQVGVRRTSLYRSPELVSF
jgi:hypothetical protein